MEGEKKVNFEDVKQADVVAKCILLLKLTIRLLDNAEGIVDWG